MSSLQDIIKRTEFIPGELWLDNNGVHINAHGGGIMRHEGIYYWYGDHKVGGEAGLSSQVGIHVYSSTDLYNWTDRGIAMDIRESRTPGLEPGNITARPKVLYCTKTGQFVMWFHFEYNRPYVWAMCGVSVSDTPVGPFRLLNKFNPNPGIWPENIVPRLQDPELIKLTGLLAPALRGSTNDVTPLLSIVGLDFKKGQQVRDMTLFHDDDGKAYLVYSSEINATTHIAELTDDYLALTGRYWRVFPNRWMEAPCLFKHDGKYYFIGSDCTGWAPNAARSAVADHIYGPWTELGNPAIGDGKEITFDSQSSFVLTLEDGRHIYMGDRWTKEKNDSRYIWLSIKFEKGQPAIHFRKDWKL